MFCRVLLCVLFSFAIILMGKRKSAALLCLSSWCLAIVIVLYCSVALPYGAVSWSAVWDCGIS